MTIKTLLFTIFSLAMVAAVHGMAFRGSNQHVPSTFNNSIESNGDNECVACQLIYSGVVGTVKIQNATVAELEKVSKEVCDLRISNFTAPDAVHEEGADGGAGRDGRVDEHEPNQHAGDGHHALRRHVRRRRLRRAQHHGPRLQ